MIPISLFPRLPELLVSPWIVLSTFVRMPPPRTRSALERMTTPPPSRVTSPLQEKVSEAAHRIDQDGPGVSDRAGDIRGGGVIADQGPGVGQRGEGGCVDDVNFTRACGAQRPPRDRRAVGELDLRTFERRNRSSRVVEATAAVAVEQQDAAIARLHQALIR